MHQVINVETRDGPIEGYFAAPASGRGPGLVILPEIYNANAWVREVADSYAADGYFALAPDIYWRQGPRQYQPYTPEGLQRGRELGTVLEADVDRAIADIGLCAEALRRMPGVNGKVGVIGYCLGGKLAFLAGTRLPVDAVAIYYGVRMLDYLDEARSLTAPTIMHFGDQDAHIPPEMYRTIRERLAGMSNVAIHLYNGAGHGFARFGQPTCDPEAAALAKARTLELLRGLEAQR